MRIPEWLIIFLLAGILAVGCQAPKTQLGGSKAVADSVLDDWHDAAEQADFDRYFNHFASDSAIFMGTDATERWTISEFRPWAKPYFDRGQAWNFTPVDRHVYLSENKQIAWFDESLDTPNLGPARGTGVLQFQRGSWKIAHYNLSIPIPNAIADTVVKQVEQALNNQSE
jgi:hypothetical protein